MLARRAARDPRRLLRRRAGAARAPRARRRGRRCAMRARSSSGSRELGGRARARARPARVRARRDRAGRAGRGRARRRSPPSATGCATSRRCARRRGAPSRRSPTRRPGGLRALLARGVEPRAAAAHRPGARGARAAARARSRSRPRTCCSEIRRYGEELEGEPGRLEAVEERLAAIARLERKHGGSVAGGARARRSAAAPAARSWRGAEVAIGGRAARLEGARREHDAARRGAERGARGGRAGARARAVARAAGGAGDGRRALRRSRSCRASPAARGAEQVAVRDRPQPGRAGGAAARDRLRRRALARDARAADASRTRGAARRSRDARVRRDRRRRSAATPRARSASSCARSRRAARSSRSRTCRRSRRSPRATSRSPRTPAREPTRTTVTRLDGDEVVGELVRMLGADERRHRRAPTREGAAASGVSDARARRRRGRRTRSPRARPTRARDRARARARDAGADLGDAQRALRRPGRAEGREPPAHRLVQAARRAQPPRRASRRDAPSSPAAPATTRRRSRTRPARAASACEVFMPAEAAVAKVAAVQGYGGVVTLGGESVDDCVAAARERAAETGAVFVHPFDDPDVIVGQATLGLELLEQVPDLARVIVPIGGGGLISGVAGVVKLARPEVAGDRRPGRGVRAVPGRARRRRAARGQRPTRRSPTASPSSGPGGSRCRSSQRWVDDVVVVSEEDTAEAMVLLIERAKLVVEGAGAVGVAALLAPLAKPVGGGRRPSSCSPAATSTPGCSRSSRAVTRPRSDGACACSRVVADRPGGLAALLLCIAQAGGNLLAVEHVREAVDLQVRQTGIELTLETRGAEHAEAILAAMAEAGICQPSACSAASGRTLECALRDEVALRDRSASGPRRRDARRAATSGPARSSPSWSGTAPLSAMQPVLSPSCADQRDLVGARRRLARQRRELGALVLDRPGAGAGLLDQRRRDARDGVVSEVPGARELQHRQPVARRAIGRIRSIRARPSSTQPAGRNERWSPGGSAWPARYVVVEEAAVVDDPGDHARRPPRRRPRARARPATARAG